MSFTRDVRLELAHANEDRPEGARAELCAFALVGGALRFLGAGRYGLELCSEQKPVIERYLAMLSRFWNLRGEMRISQTDRLGGHTQYVLVLDSHCVSRALDALQLLDAAMPFGMRAVPNAELLCEEHAKRAFLRGAFLSAGFAADPQKAYHIEIAVSRLDLAECLRSLLCAFALPAKVFRRKNRYVAYLKEAESVSDALALLGASRAVMALEETRIVKGVRNEVNRQMNCDEYNAERTMAAAEKQISVIRAIERAIGLDALPAPLREIARLRLLHPEATFSELGAIAVPDIGKSGVSARMRKLESLAEEFVNQPEDTSF